MFSFLGAAFSNGVMVLFLIMIILATIGSIFLLIRSILKERRRWKQQIEQSGLISYENLEDIAKDHIQHNKKTDFSLIRIDISESASLLKSLGELQYNNALAQLINSWRGLMDGSVRISKRNEESIYIYLKVKNSPGFIDHLCFLLISESKKSIIIAGTLKVDFDINISVVSYPDAGRTYDELKQNLKLAMVAAKRKGINQFAAYDIALANKETEEYKNYMEIKSAIENKEFTLYYQPIIDFNTMEVYGAESLLRWKHKEKGVLPPSTFLNIMEHTGDINWVGFWSIEQLFKQSVQWKTQYPDSSFILTFNLSPKQLMNPLLTDELRRLVKKYRLTPADYCAEIMEFTLLESFDMVKDNIVRMQQMGFMVAVDNYGSAHSSLQSLTNLSVNIIKLARSFINEAQNNEMTYNIITMLLKYTKKNNIKIIAEGVEKEEYFEYVKTLGIEYGQGYLFARPGDQKELMNAVVLTPWSAATAPKTTI